MNIRNFQLISLLLCLTFVIGCQKSEKQQQAVSVDLAVQQIDDGQFATAIESLNALLQADSANADLLELRGIAQLELGKTSEAIDDFKAAMEIEPANVDLQVNLAAAFIEEQKAQKAIELLDPALEAEPDHADARRNRALAYTKIEKHRLAIADYTWAMELYGDIDAALYEERAQCWKAIGNERQAEIDQKIAEATDRLSSNPDDIEAIRQRAILLYELGNYELALLDLDDWIESDAKAADAYLARGNCLFILEELDGALADLNTSIKLTSDNPSAYVTRAHVYREKNEERTALEDLESALSLASDDPLIQSEVAWLLIHSSDKSLRDFERALRLATSAVEKTGGKSWNELVVLASANAVNGDFEKAVIHQNAALKLAPEVQLEELKKDLATFQAKQKK